MYITAFWMKSSLVSLVDILRVYLSALRSQPCTLTISFCLFACYFLVRQVLVTCRDGRSISTGLICWRDLNVC